MAVDIGTLQPSSNNSVGQRKTNNENKSPGGYISCASVPSFDITLAGKD
jgi:hypothetical protein